MSTEDKPFEHPLARKAKVWKATAKRGKSPNLLVIVTTLALAETQTGFNERHVSRLSKAAQEYVDGRKDLDGYLLINRAKDWDPQEKRRDRD